MTASDGNVDSRLRKDEELLKALKANLPALKQCLKSVMDEWTHDDGIYRFYHHSFKVFFLQSETKKIVDLLNSTFPGQNINTDFLTIYEQGTSHMFSVEMNKDWGKHTRPIVEAFLHAKFFLEMAIKSAELLETAPNVLPSYWAGFLTFFNMR